MYKHSVLTGIAALALGTSAMASDLSYSYLQVDIAGTRMISEGESTDGAGLGFESSLGFGKRWFGFADLDTVRYEESGTSLRFTSGSLGLGGHIALGSALDLVGRASFERLDVRFSDDILGSGSEGYNGWGAGVGLRGRVGEILEWDAGLRYRDVASLQSTVSFTVGGRYYFTPVFSMGLSFTGSTFDKDTLDTRQSSAILTLRYQPGRNR